MRLGLSSLLLLSAILLPVAAHADVYNFTFSGSGLTSDSHNYTDVITFSIDTVNDLTYSSATQNDYSPGSGITDTYTDNTGTYVSNPPPFLFIGLVSGSQTIGTIESYFSDDDARDFWNGATFVPDTPGDPYATTLHASSDSPYSLDIVNAGPSISATPEPSSLALLGTGVLGVFGIARRRFVH